MFLVEAPLVVRYGDALIGCTPDLALYHEDINGDFVLVEIDGVKNASVQLVEWKSGSVPDAVFADFNRGNHDNKLGAAFLQLSFQKYFLERLFDVIVKECVAVYCSNEAFQTIALQAADAVVVETWLKHALQLPQDMNTSRALESDNQPCDLRLRASDVLPLGRVRCKGRPAKNDLRPAKKRRTATSDSDLGLKKKPRVPHSDR